MALITASEARLQIPGLTGTGEDTNLETVIAALGMAFARWCGYPGSAPSMESASYTRYLDGPGGRELVLDVWPVISITSIYDDPTLDFTSSLYLVDSGDYVLAQADRGLVRLKSTATHGTWSETKGAIKVAYTAGYATVPADLKYAARLGVRHWWGLRQKQGLINATSAGQSRGFVDQDFLSAEVKTALASFRLPSVYL